MFLIFLPKCVETHLIFNHLKMKNVLIQNAKPKGPNIQKWNRQQAEDQLHTCGGRSYVTSGWSSWHLTGTFLWTCATSCATCIHQVLRHVTTGGATIGHRTHSPLVNIGAFHVFTFLPRDGTWRRSFRVPLLRLAPVRQTAWVCHCSANQQVPLLCVRCAVWIMAAAKS